MNRPFTIAGGFVLTLALVYLVTSRDKSISEHPEPVLAAAFANANASANFGVAPFYPSDGRIEVKNNHWTWTASKGYGYTDLQAEITWDIARTEPRIEVSQIINTQW